PAPSRLSPKSNDEPVERAFVGAGAEQELPHALPLLDLPQDVDERPAGRLRDPAPPLALLVVRRRREPLLVVRRPALVAERVVGGDRVELGSREPERHPA